MPNAVTHFEIMSKNGKTLTAFYKKMFGWETQWVKEIDYGLIAASGRGIGGGIGTKTKKSKWGVTIYVEVDDVDAYMKKAKKLRARSILAKTVVPGMVEYAVFQDPQGNIIGVVKNLTPPQTPAM